MKKQTTTKTLGIKVKAQTINIIPVVVTVNSDTKAKELITTISPETIAALSAIIGGKNNK